MASCARLRTVQLDEDDLPYRKGSNATVRSEGTGTEYYTKRGMLPSYDSQETIRASRPVSTASNSSMRVRRLSSLTDDNTRFPKLQDCAHFHYDTVDIKALKVCMCEDENDQYHHSGEPTKYFYVKITSNQVTWLARRTLQNFRMLDQKLHRCIFDRKFSHLPDLALLEKENITDQELYHVLGDYLNRFSTLAGSMLNCGSVLNWLEIDNRGNRLLAVDDSGINTPAIAAAHAIKRYTAQAADEISLEVGDIISVIDMPPTDDTIWWRGKRGFEVGFFPYECVEIIGDKVPHSVASTIPETPQNRALLKKHGKFISFLRLFFNTRPERIQLKQSGIVRERVFGCDLGEHLLNSGHDVPLVLKSCTDVIETHGLVDGIYRLSGITSNIQKLRLAFDEDRVPDLTSEEYLQDVHSISSLLKMYFRELPNPLLTYQLYDKFANAVKDEDNKLLRIHDVVQQLPPPHYRTTEYLMRHLARVAAHGHETGMHSKNLAIVWAPNLLRSKELESGGGAAALQGVGIQAVVTEFLILYADIIFSDKMPTYHSPELKKTARKPRPKSLAISTPTRLLSLEEARERALLGNIVKPDQRYIDVGGGPQSLPAKYHTVLDLPGYKKKSNKSVAAGSGSIKGKKSPGGGLKSLFKSRSGSIREQKQGRKPSLRDSFNFELDSRKAITEEDVQHWKRRRMRSAKSAESLLSLPVTSRLGSPLSESLDPNRLMNILAGKASTSPTKYHRSMSIESPRSFSSLMYPSYVLEDEGCREMAIDVNPKDIELDFSEFETSSEREKSDSPDSIRRKQSFIRTDQKRRVICHRRVPSAPNTSAANDPYQDERDVAGNGSMYSMEDKPDISFDEHMSGRDKSWSQPVLDTRPPQTMGATSVNRQRLGGVKHESLDSERFYVHSIMPAGVDDFNKNGDENGPEKRKGSKTPPKDRKKLKEAKDKSPSIEKSLQGHKDGPIRGRRSSEKENVPCDKKGEIITELPESPGSKRKLWSVASSTSEEQRSVSSSSKEAGKVGTSPFVIKRYHDYAEIDESKMVAGFESQTSASKLTKGEMNRNSLSRENSAKSQISDRTKYYRVESIENVRKSESLSNIGSNRNMLETDFPSAGSGLNRGSGSKSSSQSDFMTDISKLEQGIHNMQTRNISGKSMTKCMSIPSDIQKSLDNIHSHGGSHSDIMSSVTLSELSVSQENVFQNNEQNGAHNERRRRSTSLDGLNDESPMSRTLKEINAQIDKAFKNERHKAQTLKEMQAAHRACQKQSSFDVDSELVSYNDELIVTPTGHRSFGSMRDTDLISPSSESGSSTTINTTNIGTKMKRVLSSDSEQNKFVDRPAAEIHIAESPKIIRAHQRQAQSGESTSTTPTRPSPPASLDIACSTAATSGPGALHTKTVSQTGSPLSSPYSNVPPSKTGFRMSEEDFQKSLMSDPDCMKQFEQSMMYSPVRARSKGFPDSDRSARSSVASPFEGGGPRTSRSNRSSVTSPDASPASFRSPTHNRSFGSPESSPLAARPPRNQAGVANLDSSPQPKLKHTGSHSLNSVDSSPKSRQKSKLPLPTSAEVSPTARQKLNTSFSSSEGSPQSRQKQSANQSFSSIEGSPQSARGKQSANQSFSSIEASPPSARQKQNQSLSSSDSSPQTRHQKILNQAISSVESSPQSARGKLNQSARSVESSPQTGHQRLGSNESSPQTGSSRLMMNYGASSPQVEIKRYGHSPRSGRKGDLSHLDRRSFVVPSPKLEQRKGGSLVSSPMSPEHKQPRWEDLAGLNEFNDFNEFDMAIFNDNWKKCLAPTGDSIRQSNTVTGSSEKISGNQNEYPEVSTGTDTVVLERPSIRKSTRASSSEVSTPVEKVDKLPLGSDIETYDNVPDHEALIQHKVQKSELDRRQAHGSPKHVFTRSHTVPESSSIPQSPTTAPGSRPIQPGGPGFLEHSSSFESSSTVSGAFHATPFDNMSPSTELATVSKSSKPPALVRQTSFDSSYKKSVQVTNLGSSVEEVDSSASMMASNVSGPGYQGSYIAMSSNERSQAEFSSPGMFTKSSTNQQSSVSVSSRQAGQSSVLIRSESSQSADFSYGDATNQSNMMLEPAASQSSVGTLFPQMLEEMDVNESCLGIASHQNLSNEMKEMMQEQMKNKQAGILSPLDEVMAPFSGITSPRTQRSFFDANPFTGFDMESSIEIPADVGLVNLPEINLQYLTDGPTVIATPNVLDQLNYNPPVHQPIDNTEEEFQNAVNDDLERNLASLQEYLPHHPSVYEPDNEKYKKENEKNSSSEAHQIVSQRLPNILPPGFEHLSAISAEGVTVVDTPPPVMQDSMSSSTSSQVDLMSTSFTYPQNFDSWHYHSPLVNSLSIHGDLAPPPLEMIEICKSTLVRSKPPTGKKASNKPKKLQWEYPKVLDETEHDLLKKKSGKLKTGPSTSKNNVSSERGEEKLVLDLRPSLKKHENAEASKRPKPKTLSLLNADAVDSDHGDLSEDDVFVDPSEVTPETSFFAAGSKYFKRRDFLSYGHAPWTEDQNGNGPRDNRVFSFDVPPRLSLDESSSGVTGQQGLENRENNRLVDFAGEFSMDLGHEDSEDIRFSKAHRSSKLLTLCEKFEASQSGTAEGESPVEGEKKKQITPPEKNIVSSIRQMHESLENEKKEKDVTEAIGKPQKVGKVSLEDDKEKVKFEELSVVTVRSPVRDGTFSFGAGEICQKSPSSAAVTSKATSKELSSPQGKPPRHKGKTRTPSESSLSETEGAKSATKLKTECSPKMRLEGSPKGQKQPLIQSDEGSPKLLPHGGSPKGQRYSTEISPKMARGKEAAAFPSSAIPRLSGGSPTSSARNSDGASKIPVFRQNSFTKDESLKTTDSTVVSPRFSGSSPKGIRHSWCSADTDVGSKASDSSDQSSKLSRIPQAENLNAKAGDSPKSQQSGQKLANSPKSQSSSQKLGNNTKSQTSGSGQKLREKKSDKDKAEKKKRRGSIKELTNIFEEKIDRLGKSASSQSPTQVKLRSRVRSVSPNSAAATSGSPTSVTASVRHSMEIPTRREPPGSHMDNTAARHSDGAIKGSGSMRIGPKPFYGAK